MSERHGKREAREITEPAPTVTGKARSDEWVYDPAERSMTDSVPVTVEQAAALQSFPPDWPWQGSKTKRHEQVGNAVPPLMARVILEALRPHTPKESE